MLSDQEQRTGDALVSRLIEVRAQKQISQNEPALLTGLSRSAIRHLESGKSNPTLYGLLKISKALNVKIGRLLGSLSHKGGNSVIKHHSEALSRNFFW